MYRHIGELTYLTGMLIPVFQHMASSMRSQVAIGHVAIDRSTPFEGDPGRAIEAARSTRPSAAQVLHSDMADG